VVNVWDWETSQLVHTFPGHVPQPIAVAFSRDGRHLATGSGREGPRIWDATTGAGPLHTFPGYRNPISALAFSPDGGGLAVACYRTVKVWDATTGNLLFPALLHTGKTQCVAYSPDGLRLASSGEDKTVRIWDAQTGREVLGLRGHARMCMCVVFSPDGQRLASASADRTIRIWDATPLQGDEGQALLTFTQHSDEIRSVVCSLDGRIASAGQGGDVKVWDVATGHSSVEFKDGIFALAWHPDGRRLAVAGNDDELFTVKVWDTLGSEKPIFLPRGREYFAVAFSPDRKYLVTGRQKGAVQVWDVKTGHEVATLGYHVQSVGAVVFSPNGKLLATASYDGEVKLWDATRLGEKQEGRSLTRPARVPGPGVNVAFSPDGRRLATGGERNTAKIWDVQTGKEMQTLWGHSGEVYTLAFSPDGRWLASGGEDSTVKVWDSHTGKVVRTFRGHAGLVSSVAFTPDGRRLISGSRDKTVKVWDLTPLSEIPQR
jgi:WD40 repeat protein